MGLIATSGNELGSSVPVALFVAVLLALATIPIARRLQLNDSYRMLARVVIASAILHLVFAPVEIYVVDHFYKGVADWIGYDRQGALLASNWRGGHFMLAGSGVTGIIGNGSVSIANGIVMTIVGPDQLAAFFVFAWLAFVGTVFFYKAFAVTFPEANRRRYALLVFFFPSILFWTANVGKEAIMTLALGLTAYSMALILVRQRKGYALIIPGAALALVVRPDELILLVIGFAVAMLLRTREARHQALHLGRTLAEFAFVAAALVISTLVTMRFIHAVGGSGLTGALAKETANNKGVGAGFGSSSVSYSANPITFPRDVYNVLFNPLPFTAHSATQLLAAAENTAIAIVIVLSFPQLRHLLRAGRERAYVIVMLIYSAAFVYVFAALGNLGLITRERTLLLPMLLVLMAIPIAPSELDPYSWQSSRLVRIKPSPAGSRPAARSETLEPHSTTWESAGPAWKVAEWTEDTLPEQVEASYESSTEVWEALRVPWSAQD
jgi:hypothetical protein